tara:strand:+ start:126 stop:401 length:276 start_codon:yes stop_codon:yes gene_type:complete
MQLEDMIIKYEPHGCEYTMEDNCLLTRHDDSEEWIEVMLEHCIAEGENHYEVYKLFGKEKWYVDFLFYYAHKVEICENLLQKTNEEIKNGQ